MIMDSLLLIILAKVNRLDLLSILYKNILITLGIYQETVEEGIEINAPDAKLIGKEIEKEKRKARKRSEQ